MLELPGSPEIKLVLTDMDGTLLPPGEHVVSNRNREAIIACEEAGILVVPVTGRPRNFALPALNLLGIEGPGVFDNGATVQDIQSGEILHRKWLEPDVVRHVAAKVFEHAQVLYYEPGVFEPGLEEHIPADNEAERIERVDYDASHIYAQVAEGRIDIVSEGLRSIPDISFYSTPFVWRGENCFGIQVTHKLADKFHGVEALRHRVNIGREHTMAIGDGENDFALFANAALGVAMGNATERLKARAHHVVADVHQDGFAEALEQLVLNNQSIG